jgi:hypothetical protein
MQWEYSMVSLAALNGSALQAQLNEHGRDGWELVTILTDSGGKVGVFKRAASPLAQASAA